jgi:hypothetical protein
MAAAICSSGGVFVLRRLFLGCLMVSFCGACEKENEISIKDDGTTVNATCDDVCKALSRGDYGDCDTEKSEQYQKDTPSCINECNNHIADGKASQSGLNCAIDISKQSGADRCERLFGKECGDFW